MASRKEQKEKLRAERVAREAEQAEHAQRRSTTKKVAAAAAALVVVVAVVVGVLVGAGGGDGGDNAGFATGSAPKEAIAITEGTQEDLDKAAKASGCELKTNPEEGRNHDENGEKPVANPPTSGDHSPTAAEDRAYAPGSEPPSAKLVHSLEHGRVVFQWSDGKISDAQISTLKQLFDSYPDFLVVARNSTNMPYAVAATAWNNALVCKSFNDKTAKALRLFQIVRADRAPEQVPWPST